VLVSDMKAMLGRLLKEHIEVRAECGPGVFICADRTQVEQILLNLAVNAGDAMPDGGTLTVQVGEKVLDTGGGPPGAAFMEAPKPGRYAVLTVRDTGHGMDPATLQHMFEPFFTTREGKGTGLGLATVFGIVKQHGGHVTAASTPGRGTTFTVLLPSAGEQAATAPARPRAPAAVEGTEAVLVVEDDPSVRRLVASALSGRGYRVLLAENAAAALRMLESGGLEPEPRMLVTDIIMPGINGRELYQVLRARLPSLRVLFMSGYTDEVIGRGSLIDAGVNFLHKPFEVRVLLQRVRAILDG